MSAQRPPLRISVKTKDAIVSNFSKYIRSRGFYQLSIRPCSFFKLKYLGYVLLSCLSFFTVNPTTSNPTPVSLSFVLRIFLLSEENAKDPRLSNFFFVERPRTPYNEAKKSPRSEAGEFSS